jgi:hypothetical protein
MKDLTEALGYCLSFNLSTSSSGLQYISVIVHYADEDFVFKEGLLDFTGVGSDHSWETLAQYILALLERNGTGD